MEIRVYLTNGAVHLLRVENPGAARQTLAAIRPAKLFSQPVLQVQGSRAALVINPADIEFIEFETNIVPEWPSERFPGAPEPGAPPGRPPQPIRCIASEDYVRLRHELLAHGQRDHAWHKPRMQIDAVAELQFKSGDVRHIQAHGELEPGEDRRRFSLRVFDRPAIEARWERGGFTLVNPKNVTTFFVTPGPTEPSSLAWHAEPVIEPYGDPEEYPGVRAISRHRNL